MYGYDTRFMIVDYDEFYNRLKNLNTNSVVSVSKEAPLGKTRCGFDIEHYRCGNGPIHIVYMGGLKGDEIIGVDYVLTLMENIAKGNGVFKDFDPNVYTLDFLPCINPEGYFATTYALKSVTKNMGEEELAKFASMYYKAYLRDDLNVMVINKSIEEVCKKMSMSEDKANNLVDMFWRLYRYKEITFDDLITFLSINVHDNDIESVVNEVISRLRFDKDVKVGPEKWHYKLFRNVDLSCIPSIDESHILLRNNLTRLYNSCGCPISTLGCFSANSVGVNIEKNNIESYNSMRTRISSKSDVYAHSRNNGIIISKPSPLGAPNYNMNENFTLEPENKALVHFLNGLRGENHLCVICGGSGNNMYIYPYALATLNNKDESIKKMMFYTNNRLSSIYSNELGVAREDMTGINKPCMVSTYKEDIYGVSDYIRRKFNTTMMLQLSTTGANPLAAYQDIKDYKVNMVAHMIACRKMMGSLIELDRIHDVGEDFKL